MNNGMTIIARVGLLGVAVMAAQAVCAQAPTVAAIVPISPSNTVLLDEFADGNGPGVPLHESLTPGNTYSISVAVSGDTGGPTRALFIWTSGWQDDAGVNHNTRYTVVNAGCDVEFYYPRTSTGGGPVVYAFFADAQALGDNHAAGKIRIVQLNE